MQGPTNQRQRTNNDPMSTVRYCRHELMKRWQLIFLFGLLLAVAGIVVVSLIPNQYKATTTILVDPQKIPERYVASTITTDLNAHMSTLTQQVLSATRLQEVIDDEHLYADLRGRKSREQLLDYMRSKIKIDLKQASEQGISSFSISYIDKDRWQVASVTNRLASRFIDWNLRNRQQQATVTTQFLSTELQQAKNSLEQQESALQAFRMQHIGSTPDQLNVNVQTISRLQSDVQSNVDSISRLDEERILLTQQRRVDTRDPSALNERDRLLQERSRLENDLQNLRRQYTDTYPDVVNDEAQLKSLNARMANMPEPASGSLAMYDSATQMRLGLIDKQMERHKEQIGSLQQQIGSYQGKVQSVPVLETRLAELTRNYETSRQNYQSLLDKRLSAGMSEDLEKKQQSESFTILDPASTPEKPFAPKRIPLIGAAVLVAILLSLGSTIGFALLKGAVRSDAEVQALLPPKVRILATVPPIISNADMLRSRLINIEVVFASILACAGLILFFMRVRPIL
jgi:succinoglycan biosynthesis transport protein ExoP